MTGSPELLSMNSPKSPASALTTGHFMVQADTQRTRPAASVTTVANAARAAVARTVRSDAFLTLVLASLYFQIVFGFAVVNPRNIGWLLDAAEDLMLFLTTNSYFRFSDWSFPITSFDTLLYPVGTSMAAADGAPLLAVLFKLLDPLLPRGIFQYFGAWLFVCVWLQALVAKRALSLLRVSLPLQWIGTLLLTANLPQAFAIWHFPLWAHFLFLYGFYLVLLPELAPRRICLLVAVASWINPYLFVMVLATCTAAFVRHRRAPRLARSIVLTAVVALLSCYLVGFFHIPSSKGAVGEYMADLATLFNADKTGRLGPQLSPIPQWDEGYGYLGLGGIALLLLLVAKSLWPSWRARRVHEPALLVVCVVMALYAVGTNPLYRGQHLGEIEWLRDLAEPVVGRLRSIGRFVWPIWAYVMLFGVRAIHELIGDKRIALGVGISVLALQVADVGPWLANITRPMPPRGVMSPVPPELSRQVTSQSRLLLLPPELLCKGGPARRRGMWGLAMFGVEHRLASNSDFGSLSRFSRADQAQVCRVTKQLWRERDRHPEIVFVDPQFVERVRKRSGPKHPVEWR